MQANPENGREPRLTKFAVMLWKTTLRYYDKIVPPERRDICSEQVFKGIDSNDIRIKEIIIIESREEVIGGVLNESSFCIFGRGNWLQAKTEDCKIDTRVFFASLSADKDDYDSEIVDGITILPTGEIFKALPYSNAKIINAIERGNWGHNKNRDIVECVNNRYLKPFLIYLESKQDIQEEPAPAGEPPAPDAASDAAETVEAEPGAGALAYPDGLEVIKENNGGALDADFLKEVLPNVQYIRGTETDRPERWEHPSQIKHRDRCPWTVFEWKGIKYRAWKEEDPKKKYAVKWEIQERGTPTNRVFDFKNEV